MVDHTECDTCSSSSVVLAPGGPAVTLFEPRVIPTRPVRTISMTPYGRSTSNRPSILSFRTGCLDHDGVGHHVHHTRAKDVDELHDVRS